MIISKGWPAPAKINLFLQINGRREDGYHNLQTVFQFINVCDYIDFQVRDDGIIDRDSDLVGVSSEDDLTVKSAKLLREYVSGAKGATISVQKRIPMGAGLGGGHDEREQTLNQLLVEMDGFEANDGIIVIAATNRPDVLDPALLRPGRFDRQVVVGLPDIRGREQIVKVHMRKVPLGDDVDPSIIARGTPGFSGADLANLVNEAALFAARSSKRLVSMEEFDKAKDKIMMGAERKSMVMSEKEKRNTAYHEAGHAIVGRLMPDHDPVYKVTIIPRGRALGVTMFLPEEDRYSMSRQGIRSQICSLFGGRIAEEMTLGAEHVTTGASNDIERATQLARNMVTKWGLSERMGPLLYDEDDGEVFLGMSANAKPKLHSPDTSKAIDEEVRRIVDECYAEASKLLDENFDKLHTMADALMEFETLSSEQLDDIMAGAKPRHPSDLPPSSGSSNPPKGETPIGGPAEEN